MYNSSIYLYIYINTHILRAHYTVLQEAFLLKNFPQHVQVPVAPAFAEEQDGPDVDNNSDDGSADGENNEADLLEGGVNGDAPGGLAQPTVANGFR
jgi:hypothetical protein